MTYRTELGQLLDLTTQPIAPEAEVDLKLFTMERYESIVLYKTAFYSFVLPVSLGLLAGGVADRAAHEEAHGILLKMGTYFQIQDDYLDCYGAPEVIGCVTTCDTV